MINVVSHLADRKWPSNQLGRGRIVDENFFNPYITANENTNRW